MVVEFQTIVWIIWDVRIRVGSNYPELGLYRRVEERIAGAGVGKELWDWWAEV